MTSSDLDLIIVGGGPAGLCAAMYAGRGMLKAVLLERGIPGGELLNTEKVEDMLKAGIIDPTKVTKNALQNAASIAGLMLTTEALVSEIKEKEKAPAGMPGGGGMGGMY